jgi:hypothetical protein
VYQCKPYPEHLERSSQVVKELKERDTHAKQEGRELAKRSLESGQLGDSIVVENFGIRACSSNDGPFKIVRTREEVDMQWARAVVSAGLPMRFFDNKEVRKVSA